MSERPDSWIRPQELGKLERRRAWRQVILWWLFVGALLVFPSSPVSGLPLCPFRFVTGHSCPGCGMTRSCTSLVRGEVWTSLEFHPLGIVLVGSFGLLALWRAIELVRGQHLAFGPRARRLQTVVLVAGLLFVIGFGGLRLILELMGVIAVV